MTQLQLCYSHNFNKLFYGAKEGGGVGGAEEAVRCSQPGVVGHACVRVREKEEERESGVGSGDEVATVGHVGFNFTTQ
jgi:hypothetical protein